MSVLQQRTCWGSCLLFFSQRLGEPPNAGFCTRACLLIISDGDVLPDDLEVSTRGAHGGWTATYGKADKHKPG